MGIVMMSDNEGSDSILRMIEMLNEPYVNIASYVAGAVLTLYLMRKWAMKWNAKFNTTISTE